MPKQVMFSDEGRAALLRGVNIMAAAVKATMGPKGKLASFLGDFGPALLRKYKPKGIVVFSAHWETEGERLGMFIYMLYMIFHTEVYKNNH